MLKVITEATVEPITVQEAKDWLGIQGTAHDIKLQAAIPAARKKVESLAGRSLVARTFELYIQEYESDYIELPYPEINAITSLKTIDIEGVETVQTAYSLVKNRLNFVGWGDLLQVQYTTLANTEEFYKLAVKKQLAYDYRNEYKENGFDTEVIKMISSQTVNLGY